MKNVLIGEDNFISGKMLKEIVENLGHNVIGIASNAEKALIYVKNTIPDLVFMDINLSGEMNGLYLTELLSGFYNVNVVFVTIHADPKTITYAKKIGSGYIIKPFTLNDIESILNVLPKEKLKVEESKKHTDIIHIKDDNSIMFLKYSDVIFIESQAHSMIIQTKEEAYTVRNSLKNILSMDENNTFIQVHRSFIVNKDQIDSLINDKYTYKIKLKDSDILIPVSKKNLQKIKNKKTK